MICNKVRCVSQSDIGKCLLCALAGTTKHNTDWKFRLKGWTLEAGGSSHTNFGRKVEHNVAVIQSV